MLVSATLSPMSSLSAKWVRAAHGDAWQALGIAGVAEVPGVRLMATGLPHPQWNNGDVDEPALVDLDAVRDWYANRGLPWGLRLPLGAVWPHGHKLFTKRLMGLTPSEFRAAAPVDGLAIRVATPADLPAVLTVDAVAFEESTDLERPWLELLLAHPAVTVALAQQGASPSPPDTSRCRRAGRARRRTSAASRCCPRRGGGAWAPHCRRGSSGAAATQVPRCGTCTPTTTSRHQFTAGSDSSRSTASTSTSRERSTFT